MQGLSTTTKHPTPAERGLRAGWWTYRRRQQLWGFLFALPAVILFAVFAIYPILQTFYLSFFDFNLVDPPQFVGLRNFETILTTSAFRDSIAFTFRYAFGTYIPTLVLALALALALNTKLPGRSVLRMVNFIPVVISWVIVAVVWKLIFHQNGLMNVFLSSLGLYTPDWLLSRDWAPYAIIIPSIWKEIGFYMVIFLAGLQNIPTVYYEAGKIDGTSAWQAFRYITLPLLRPTIVLAIVISIINGLKIFIPPFVMTQGGPAGSTRVMALIIYQTAFANGRMGRASAMAVMLFLIILLFTLIQNRLYGTGRDVEA
ncbi:MAG: sugar ABC transporter permease [Chloroflexota bacterium]|nr:MAG: sugar ABC transporter permease [Chloroflexota bacterium]